MMFIMLLVLLCFNLFGEGFEVVLLCIIDMLIGCVIVWVVVSFIWLDWKFCNLLWVLDWVMNVNCCYLDVILEQYYQGCDNWLVYCVVCCDVYNCDVELVFVVLNLLIELCVDVIQ